MGKCGFLTGWAIPPSWYQLPEHVITIDSTELITKTEGLTNLSDIQIAEIFSIDDTLVCFSLGSLIALSLFPMLQCKKLILVAPTFSFCCSPQNKFGIPPKIVSSMIRAIESGNEATLTQFYFNCGLPTAPVHTYTKEMLVEGLQFLKSCQIDRSTLSNSREIAVLHGENDRIIPFESGKAVADYFAISCRTVPGGHIAPLEDLFTSYFNQK